MGWQKTFTLSRRAKGCHLVTNEILAQIEPGLQGIQVSIISRLVEYTAKKICETDNGYCVTDWNAVSVHVSFLSRARLRLIITSL